MAASLATAARNLILTNQKYFLTAFGAENVLNFK